MDTADPVEDRLVGDVQCARDLLEAGAFFVHPQCIALLLSPKGATFRFAYELPEAADLTFGRPLRLRVVKELRRAGASVVVRAHVAGTTEGDEVLHRVVAGETERDEMMNVERAPVLFFGLSACSTHDIS